MNGKVQKQRHSNTEEREFGRILRLDISLQRLFSMNSKSNKVKALPCRGNSRKNQNKSLEILKVPVSRFQDQSFAVPGTRYPNKVF